MVACGNSFHSVMHQTDVRFGIKDGKEKGFYSIESLLHIMFSINTLHNTKDKNENKRAVAAHLASSPKVSYYIHIAAFPKYLCFHIFVTTTNL